VRHVSLLPHTAVLTHWSSAIRSEVHLYSSRRDHRGGAFNVRAESANGHISTAVRALPLDARLALKAQSAIGGIELALPSTFEGVFSGEMAVGRPVVSVDDKVLDPAGEHRGRDSRYRTSRSAFDGMVHWVPRHDDAPESTVRLETSMGGISLRV
jgi:hypothetical protein